MAVLRVLSHWGWVTHICISKLTIIGSDNGLSPERHQAIIWTNAGILLIEPLGTNFSEISNEIHTFSFKKMHLKMSSAKWRPFCLGLNVLMTRHWESSYQRHLMEVCYLKKPDVYGPLCGLKLTRWGQPHWRQPQMGRIQGPSFPGMGIPMLKIRRSQDRLIFNMGIPILARQHLYIEMARWASFQYQNYLSREGSNIHEFFSGPTLKILHFSKTDCIQFRRKFCLNPVHSDPILDWGHDFVMFKFFYF